MKISEGEFNRGLGQNLDPMLLGRVRSHFNDLLIHKRDRRGKRCSQRYDCSCGIKKVKKLREFALRRGKGVGRKTTADVRPFWLYKSPYVKIMFGLLDWKFAESEEEPRDERQVRACQGIELRVKTKKREEKWHQRDTTGTRTIQNPRQVIAAPAMSVMGAYAD